LQMHAYTCRSTFLTRIFVFHRILIGAMFRIPDVLVRIRIPDLYLDANKKDVFYQDLFACFLLKVHLQKSSKITL